MTKYAVQITKGPAATPWLSYTDEHGLRRFVPVTERAIFRTTSAAAGAIESLPEYVRSVLDLQVVGFQTDPDVPILD